PPPPGFWGRWARDCGGASENAGLHKRRVGRRGQATDGRGYAVHLSSATGTAVHHPPQSGKDLPELPGMIRVDEIGGIAEDVRDVPDVRTKYPMHRVAVHLPVFREIHADFGVQLAKLEIGEDHGVAEPGAVLGEKLVRQRRRDGADLRTRPKDAGVMLPW